MKSLFEKGLRIFGLVFVTGEFCIIAACTFLLYSVREAADSDLAATAFVYMSIGLFSVALLYSLYMLYGESFIRELSFIARLGLMLLVLPALYFLVLCILWAAGVIPFAIEQYQTGLYLLGDNDSGPVLVVDAVWITVVFMSIAYMLLGILITEMLISGKGVTLLLRFYWTVFLSVNTVWVMMNILSLFIFSPESAPTSSLGIVQICAMLGLLGLWILLLNNNFSSPYIQLLTLMLLFIGIVTGIILAVVSFSIGVALSAPVVTLFSLWVLALVAGAVYGMRKKVFVKK